MRHSTEVQYYDDFGISIHALQRECDKKYFSNRRIRSGFLSTHSKRSATDNDGNIIYGSLNFYPRTPNGVRQRSTLWMMIYANFYPRTPNGVRQRSTLWMMIYANFYPRTPNGVRLVASHKLVATKNFYPRTPNGVRLRM